MTQIARNVICNQQKVAKTSNDQRGNQARPWTHKKHPKYVLLGLKFASLNKYSSGIWHGLNKDFSFLKTVKSWCNDFTPKQVQFHNLLFFGYSHCNFMCDTITDITYDRLQLTYTRLCGHDLKSSSSPCLALILFFYLVLWQGPRLETLKWAAVFHSVMGFYEQFTRH